MKIEEFGQLVKGMKAVYSQPTFIPDQDAFNIWFAMLQDIPYKVASISTQQYIMTHKFPPTVADIRELCTTTQKAETLNESEAWNMVYKAICNSGYNSENEFEKLPEDIKKAVGSPNQLRAWAIDENFNIGVESSNFKKVYRNVQERNKSLNALPEGLRKNLELLSSGEMAQIEGNK